MNHFAVKPFAAALLILTFGATQAHAAIALDRTRVIYTAAEKSVSLSITNQNKQLPYLAQGWLEDEHGTKITSPLIVLPPIQRLEPGASSQLKIQGLPAIASLPKDQESLFYFNLREIPPRSEKTNTLQIALQTRIKLFYRPDALVPQRDSTQAPWQEKITLTRQDNRYVVNNPTPYYVTLIDAKSSFKSESAEDFEPLMIAPNTQGKLSVNAQALGQAPVLTYINDFGGRPQLQFACTSNTCSVNPSAKAP
ncbi:fimbria/pilus periplasmic chaperone [Pseudomonas shahriarae]|uniref:fimbria/pilus periplasmic chaperone n=1 Tax=Pseudomonas shahriarae TaxID=2745512 RepID=UPI0023623A2D|nr:fimbria/pilus periplasmic chaperone [Pseudomonas shahriarae]MDD1135704.1 fimbria/pilus periplasmic chaperone [Pseudomonas shahriarae]